MMDLKLKGINWVGNIYQKFEAICQEVDDIVNQDTIKYVEGQVQTVGESVKKLCSDVIQDLLPPLGDPVKHGTKDVVIKENSAMSTKTRKNSEENSFDATEKQSPTESNVLDPVKKLCFDVIQDILPPLSDSVKHGTQDVAIKENSAISTKPRKNLEENSLDATEKESPAESNVLDPVTNQLSECHLGHQLSYPTSMDTLEGSDLSEGKIDDILTNENSDANNEEISIEVSTPILLELTSPSVAEDFTLSPFGVFVHSNHENKHAVQSEVSLATSTHGLEFESLQKSTVCDNFADGIECLSGASNTTSEMVFSVVSGENSVSEMGSASFSSSDANESLRLSEYSPENLSLENSALGLEFESPQKYTVCDNFADEIECISGALNTTSEMVFSVVSGENSVSEMGFASFSSSDANESLRLCEYSPENLSLEKVVCHNSVEAAGCVSDSSNGLPLNSSSLTMSSKDKDAKMGLSSFSSVLSLESVAEGTSRITETMPLRVPSGEQQVQNYESVQSEAVMSFFNIGWSNESSCDIASSMETIDLHAKVKLEESCVIVNDSELHAISCRTRKLRSYKKKIRDAFASKKRLEKEYEQLAIWYGDTDIDSSQETPSNMENFQTHHACDSEWELL